MTVISEGLLLNSKYIKMSREERVFKLSSHSHLLLSIYGFATVMIASHAGVFSGDLRMLNNVKSNFP